MKIIHLGYPPQTWQGRQHEAASVQGYGAVAEGGIADLSDDQARFLLATGCWAPVTESDDPMPRKAQAWRARAKDRTRLLAAATQTDDQTTPESAPQPDHSPAQETT